MIKDKLIKKRMPKIKSKSNIENTIKEQKSISSVIVKPEALEDLNLLEFAQKYFSHYISNDITDFHRRLTNDLNNL